MIAFTHVEAVFQYISFQPLLVMKVVKGGLITLTKTPFSYGLQWLLRYILFYKTHKMVSGKIELGGLGLLSSQMMHPAKALDRMLVHCRLLTAFPDSSPILIFTPGWSEVLGEYGLPKNKAMTQLCL